MRIAINDVSRELPDGATIAELLAAMELNVRHVAVEVNLDLVPRTRHAEHVLRDGDRVEVVTLVGGG